MKPNLETTFFIELDNIQYCLPGTSRMIPCEPVSLTITPDTSLVHIMGENGSGKTTLLKIISSELSPTKGTVSYSINQYTDIISMFQFDGLFPKLSVSVNLAFSGTNTGEISSLIDEFNVRNLLKIEAEKLSAGENKKIQFMRCILSKRKIWLLDEPVAGVDDKTSELFATKILKFLFNKGVVVIVSHNNDWNKNIIEVASKKYMTSTVTLTTR
jgi:heme exporter protein A